MKCSEHCLLKFLRQNKGSIAVSFAFMLPTLIGFYSLIFDGARFNFERARLADALNQSAYAVAVADNRNVTKADKAANVDKVWQYFRYYLPDKWVDQNSITVSEKLNYNDKRELTSVDYNVNADLITHPMLTKTENTPGFDANITLRGNGLSGIVRRTAIVESVPTDYVFVVDFSSSMKKDSAEPNLSREKLLKKVVNTLGEKIFELDNGSTIGIVPYSDGSPVRLDKTNYASPQGRELGCSYIAKLKDKYESLDLNFWYNKPRDSTSVGKYIDSTDAALEDYYRKVIARANGYSDSTLAADWLVSKGYCAKQEDGKLFCDADSQSNIHNPANRAELNNNLSNFLALTAFERNDGMLNINTVDIAGTLTGDYLFKESNVKNFVSFMGRKKNIPFYKSCYNSYVHSDSMYSIIKTQVRPSYYIIDLSSDSNIFTEFNAMTLGKGTDSLWGLLRAVPLLAKGTNERKMLFVISDGDDTNPTLRNTMMDDYALCDVIREGLKTYPEGTATTSASLYYISLVNNKSATEWANKCVGAGNAYIATNLNDLTNVIGSLMFKNYISFINPNEIK